MSYHSCAVRLAGVGTTVAFSIGAEGDEVHVDMYAVSGDRPPVHFLSFAAEDARAIGQMLGIAAHTALGQ